MKIETELDFRGVIWLVLAGLAAIIFGHILFKMPLVSCLLLAASIFMLAVFFKPLFGLIATVPLVLYFSYIDVIWISPWNYLIAGLGCLAAVTYYKRKTVAPLYACKSNQLSTYTRKIYVVSLLFFILMSIINFIQSNDLKLSAQFIPLFFIAFCTMVFVRNENDLKLLIYCLIGFMSISAFVGIMQFAKVDFFWQLREMQETTDPIVVLQIQERQRIPGLAYYNIQFAYQLANVVPLVFAILLSKTKKTKFELFYLTTAFLVCFYASIISKSKSLVIAVTAALVWVAMKSSISKRSKNTIVFLFSAILVLVVIYCLYFEVYEESESSLTKINAGNLARIPLFWAGFRVFLENPWGIGTGNFNVHARKFYPQLMNMPGADHLLVTATHNQFLNILVYYGILGLFLIILFYNFILKGILNIVRRPPDNFTHAVATGLFGTFLAYLIQSMFHNAGHFTIDPFGWYFVGLSIFLFNYSYCSETHNKS
jgi:heme/copper-type cytochrome/quinol oxidase subunit 4